MLDKLLFLLGLAGVAVVYADVLVRDGMLLAPVQRWLRAAKYKLFARRFKTFTSQEDANVLQWFYEEKRDLDSKWWWAPLWGCYICVAGQWGFWGYLIRYHGAYSLPEHLAFTAFTIIAAIILHKWTKD